MPDAEVEPVEVVPFAEFVKLVDSSTVVDTPLVEAESVVGELTGDVVLFEVEVVSELAERVALVKERELIVKSAPDEELFNVMEDVTGVCTEVD